jgi:hypothetical protein
VVLEPHPASLSVRLVVAGHADPLRQLVHHVLERAGWKMWWDPTGWAGMATKGDKTANFLLGAFAQYHELRFAFQALPDGTTALMLYRTGSGCMGGLIGVYQVRKSFRLASGELHQAIATFGPAQGLNVIGVTGYS